MQFSPELLFLFLNNIFYSRLNMFLTSRCRGFDIPCERRRLARFISVIYFGGKGRVGVKSAAQP